MTHTGAASAGAAGFQIRPAREADLDVIAWFEIEIRCVPRIVISWPSTPG